MGRPKPFRPERARFEEPGDLESTLHRGAGIGISTKSILKQEGGEEFMNLIKVCRREGDVSTAEHLLQTFGEKQQELTVDVLNSIIHVCTRAGDGARAEQYMEYMETMGIQANRVTYNLVINACANTGDSARAEMWVKRMAEKGVEPNEVTYGTLCKCLGREGKPDKIEEIMNSLNRPPNEFFYAALIFACAISEPPQPQRAEAAFHRLVAQGLRVHSVKRVLRQVLGEGRATMLIEQSRFLRSRHPGSGPAAAPKKSAAAAAWSPTGASQKKAAPAGSASSSPLCARTVSELSACSAMSDGSGGQTVSPAKREWSPPCATTPSSARRVSIHQGDPASEDGCWRKQSPLMSPTVTTTSRLPVKKGGWKAGRTPARSLVPSTRCPSAGTPSDGSSSGELSPPRSRTQSEISPAPLAPPGLFQQTSPPAPSTSPASPMVLRDRAWLQTPTAPGTPAALDGFLSPATARLLGAETPGMYSAQLPDVPLLPGVPILAPPGLESPYIHQHAPHAGVLPAGARQASQFTPVARGALDPTFLAALASQALVTAPGPHLASPGPSKAAMLSRSGSATESVASESTADTNSPPLPMKLLRMARWTHPAPKAAPEQPMYIEHGRHSRELAETIRRSIASGGVAF